MNIDKINETISNYNELVALATSKIKIIEILDNRYNTARRIEDIYFGDDLVNVVCDDTFMGCYDSRYFEFPVEWLSKTDSEIAEIVLIAKELRIEKERKANEEKQLKEKKDAEQLEFEQYKRLKDKFE